ncbi:hypothetical protein MRY82_01960 [bacterium]|nr:hypothetical protein [bacterium]
MDGIVLGIDIHSAYIDVCALYKKEFRSVRIPGQQHDNRIYFNIFSSEDYIYHNHSPLNFNTSFIPYSLVWGVEKQDIDPFFLHTFPEHFIFDNNLCVGLQNFNTQIVFDAIFKQHFDQLAQTIKQQISPHISALNLHMPEHYNAFLVKSLTQLLESSFQCKVKLHSSKSLIVNPFNEKNTPLKQHVHVFANYTKPYLYYYNSKNSQLHHHMFTQNLYRLDLAFLEKMKYQLIKSITPYHVSFNAHQRNQLFNTACHLRRGLTEHTQIKAFIPALCYSDEHGLHDFNFSFQRNDYEQFIQQNSADFLKEMDTFFLSHKILPHDIHTLFLHGEGLDVPGLGSVLTHYFQKPKETLIAKPNFIVQRCASFQQQ